MARSRNTVQLDTVAAEDTLPLVGAHGPTLQTALQAFVTWGTSRTFREQVMADCDFPMPGDLPAFLVVNQLIYRGIATPTDLADAIDTTRSNMSKIVARLEAADLVFRATDPRDDRGVVIGLSAQGRELGRRILHIVNIEEHDLPGWSRDEVETFERLAVKFARTIDALPGHPLSTATGLVFRGEAER